ncbi:MAG: hypothetical protein RLZZ106_616 [Cyanobacteriota bacterium]|jgi:hypothetical protein
MAHRQHSLALLLTAVISLPALPATAAFAPEGAASGRAALLEQAASGEGSSELLARKGGGGGRSGGRSGGSRGGGGRGGSRGASGFKHSGSSLNRGSKPPQGGWSKKSSGKASPSLDRSGSKNRNDNRGGNRSDNRNSKRDDRNRQTSNDNRRGERNDSRNKNRDDRFDSRQDRRDDRWDSRDKRRDDRWDNRDNRRDDRWHNRNKRWDDRWDRYPGWARPGWGYARPWNYGWYGGWSSPSWGWWGASAAAWGITTLTTAAIINAAVDDAVNAQSTTIVVPNSDYNLLYGTVQPVNDQSVRFAIDSGGSEVQMSADCRAGTLDGRSPNSAAEAELLNAACQVAFGNP